MRQTKGFATRLQFGVVGCAAVLAVAVFLARDVPFRARRARRVDGPTMAKVTAESLRDLAAGLEAPDLSRRRETLRELRAAAAELRDDRALLALLESLARGLGDSDPANRWEAASALAKAAADSPNACVLQQAVPSLVRAVRQHRGGSRVAAAFALGNLAAVVEGDAPLRFAVRSLCTALADPNEDLRREAARALTCTAAGLRRSPVTSRPSRVDGLVDRVMQTKGTDRYAAWALGNVALTLRTRTAPDQAMRVLLDSVESPRTSVRRQVLGSLRGVAPNLWAATGPDLPVQHLLIPLRRDDRRDRREALGALREASFHFSHPARLAPAVLPLTRALGDPEREIRAPAAAALRGLAERLPNRAPLLAALPALTRAVQDPAREVQFHATCALADLAPHVTDPERVELVESAFEAARKGDSPTLRLRAQHGLNRLPRRAPGEPADATPGQAASAEKAPEVPRSKETSTCPQP